MILVFHIMISLQNLYYPEVPYSPSIISSVGWNYFNIHFPYSLFICYHFLLHTLPILPVLVKDIIYSVQTCLVFKTWNCYVHKYYCTIMYLTILPIVTVKDNRWIIGVLLYFIDKSFSSWGSGATIRENRIRKPKLFITAGPYFLKSYAWSYAWFWWDCCMVDQTYDLE